VESLHTETPADRVGEIILRTGLLDHLPVAGNVVGTRNLRPQVMTPRRALLELASWNDDKALDTLVIDAFRSQARRLLTDARVGTRVTRDPRTLVAVP
jgi:hypothetical protein